MKRVVVVGGGLSGLAAAYRLTATRPDLDVSVFEASGRAGGWVRTERHEGFVIDRGPEAILTEKPYALELAEQLGISDQIIETNTEHRGAYVVCRKKLERIPDGFVLLGAADLGGLFNSSVLSWRGKLRAALEPMLPNASQPDENLRAFVTRRYGRELYDRLAQPIAGGVYGGDPARLSMAAALGKYHALETEAGSVTRGLGRRLAAQRQRAAGARYGMFINFRHGMQTLTDALVTALGDRLVLGRGVSACVPDGGQWQVRDTAGTVEQADAIIVALPAPHASEVFQDALPDLSHELGGIEYGDAVTVTLAYDVGAFAQPLDAFGFVVPSVEKMDVMASTWSSVKWAGRAPDGQALVRVFVGGHGREAVFTKDDRALVALAHQALDRFVGVDVEARFHRVDRWTQAMPRYYMGHIERVNRIFSAAQRTPGLALAGNAYRGVGIPDTINVSNQAATQTLAFLDAQAP